MDKEQKRVTLQVILLLLTIITTTIAGAEWIFGSSVYTSNGNGGVTLNSNYKWQDFLSGIPFSFSFLLILSVHEFGHYFTARYHQIKTSLPYYIPLPPFPTLIGTLGAIIRIRQRVPTTSINFDIGIAGPLAGFVAAVVILSYGFITLPPPEYIFQIHPGYQQFGLTYANHVYTPEYLVKNNGMDMIIGDNLFFKFLSVLLADPNRMPNNHEIMHYPFLFAGYLSLVFTALNLIPIGQLDGGHVVYGLFGAKGHRWIASTFFIAFVFFAGIGIIRPGIVGKDILWNLPLYIGFLFFTCRGLGFETKTTVIISLIIFLVQYLLVMFWPATNGFHGWLLFAFLLGRFMGVRHPGAEKEVPLTTGRKILGWIALLILVLCLTPNPIEMISYAPEP